MGLRWAPSPLRGRGGRGTPRAPRRRRTPGSVPAVSSAAVAGASWRSPDGEGFLGQVSSARGQHPSYPAPVWLLLATKMVQNHAKRFGMRLSRRGLRRRILLVPRRKGAEPRIAMTIRVPKSLRERLDKAAERDRRLVSDYIVVPLEDAVAASEAAAAAAAAKK